MVDLLSQDRAYNSIVALFDRAGFQVWSPKGGHLNQDLSEAAADIMADDSRAWGIRTAESDSDWPLTSKRPYHTDQETQGLLAQLKASLKEHGFRVTEELPNLTDGFSALAEGVIAKKVTDRIKCEELHVIISQLPELAR